MDAPLNVDDAFARFDERWAPRVIARINDYDVRIAKVEGDHAWHSHRDTDEFFMCLAGRFTIEMRDRTVALGPGDVFTVPARRRALPARRSRHPDPDVRAGRHGDHRRRAR